MAAMVSPLPPALRLMAASSRATCVPTGTGGGSPRVVPSLLAPDVPHPANGHALYVFALPEKK